MLHPISYISEIYCGPAEIDVETAVSTYADKLAGRRRRLDMSITTLSVATLRDVDDMTRALTRATRSWLVEGPIADAEAMREAAEQQLLPSSSSSPPQHLSGNIITAGADGIQSNTDSDDDDDLIIASSAAPTTNIIRRGGDGLARTEGGSSSYSFFDLLLRAKTISGPSLPMWEDLLRGSEGSVGRLAKEQRDREAAVAAKNEAGGCGAAPTSSSDAKTTEESDEKPSKEEEAPLSIAMQCETIDLSSPLDRRLLDELEVERFDEFGCSRTTSHTSGLPTIASADACPWARGAFGAEGCRALDATSSSSSPSPSTPLRVRVLFPNLTTLDLGYSRVTSIDLFEGCKTLKYLRLTNNLGVRSIPRGLEGLVVFEAERCYALEDIHSGLSGLPLLAMISIDEAYRVKRLPTRLPMLDQLNISRTDGLCYPSDVNGETFADPLNYPCLEELFIHGQRTIKRLAPEGWRGEEEADGVGGGDAQKDDGEKGATSASPSYVLPKLQMLIASSSVVEDIDDALSGHPNLSRLVMGPLCRRIPRDLSSITNVDASDCVHLRSLSPLVGSDTLESLNISRTEGLTELVAGAGEEAWESEAEEEGDGVEGADGARVDDAFTAGLAAAVAVNEAASEEFPLSTATDAVPADAGATDAAPAAEAKEKEKEVIEANPQQQPPTEDVASAAPAADAPPPYPVPAFPNLSTFIAQGAAITSLQPLKDSTFLEHLDISSTQHIKTIPSGLCSLDTLIANYSGLRSLDAMEGNRMLTTLHISYAEKLRALPPLPGIQRINDHKANFFLKMYVVSNLQQRGVRMFLRQERDERRRAAMMNVGGEGGHRDPMDM